MLVTTRFLVQTRYACPHRVNIRVNAPHINGTAIHGWRPIEYRYSHVST